MMNATARAMRTGTSYDFQSAPVVFVPGFGHIEAGIEIFHRHLERAGFIDVSVLECRPTEDIPDRAQRLARHTSAILACTGANRVHLVGHSVGGVVARYYVHVLGGSSDVTSVTFIGTPHAGSHLLPAEFGPAAAQLRPGSAVLRTIEAKTVPTHVRWVNYACDHDLFVHPLDSGILDDPRLDAINIRVEEYGHLSVALPASVSRSLAQQLAALEGRPGFGSPVATLPGGAIHLATATANTSESLDAAHDASRVHTAGRSKPLRLVEPLGA